jgi:hypothetical protein
VFQQQETARAALARDHAPAGQAARAIDAKGIPPGQDQTLLAPRPLDQDHRLAGEPPLDMADVPAIVLDQMQARADRVAPNNPLEAETSSPPARNISLVFGILQEMIRLGEPVEKRAEMGLLVI